MSRIRTVRSEMYGNAHSHPLIMTPLTENHESKLEKVNILLTMPCEQYTGWGCLVCVGFY